MTDVKAKVALALGMGLRNMVRVATNEHTPRSRPTHREKTLDERIAEGRSAPRPDPVPKFKRRKH